MSSILAAIGVLSLLMSVHELGHLLVAKLVGLQVEEFGLGYPPRILTITRRGATEYTLNWILFGAFVRLADQGEPGSLFAEQSKRARAAFLVGGAACNLLLSIVLFSICFATGWPVAHDWAVGVNKVLPGSVAEAVGFEDNDLILAVDGHPISNMMDLVLYARAIGGEVRAVSLRRSGRSFVLALPAGAPWFVKAETRGVQLHAVAGWEETVTYPWLQAVQKALGEVAASLASFCSIPIDLLRGILPVDMVRPVGPVGIARLTGQAAQQAVAGGWWFPLLQLTASLSAALAVVNLLPLPGFDGGRLLFVLIEALRGKQIDSNRENLVHLAGIVLMIMLILVVTYYDVAAPLPLRGP